MISVVSDRVCPFVRALLFLCLHSPTCCTTYLIPSTIHHPRFITHTHTLPIPIPTPTLSPSPLLSSLPFVFPSLPLPSTPLRISLASLASWVECIRKMGILHI